MRRGTTPTIRLLTSEDLSGWDRVIVTLKGATTQLDFEKDRLGFSEENGKYVAALTLTQKETFELDKNFKIQVRMVSGKDEEEVAEATEIDTITLDPVLKDGVIHVDTELG